MRAALNGRLAFLLPLTLLVVGCGVPISASEITATVVRQEQAGVIIATLAPEQATAVSRTASGVAPGAKTVSSSAASTPVPPSSTPALAASTTATVGPSATPRADGTGTPASIAALSLGLTPSATATITGTPSTSVTPTPTGTVAKTATPAGDTPAAGSDVLSLVNAYRVSKGLGALTPNADLNAAATKYAQYMATANFFDHNGPDGSTPSSRVAASGYDGGWRGEALTAGQATARDAVTAWQNSPPHNAILLNPDAVDVGIGYAYSASSYYKYYWVFVTGEP